MRFFIYALIIGLSAAFFLYREKDFKEAPEIPPAINKATVETFSSPATSTEKTSAVTPPTQPQPAPARQIDPKTLELIQKKISETAQSLKDLENSPPEVSQLRTRLNQEELYNKAVSRVVNFFCQQGGNVRVASGVIISPQGHILTNAHVGEGFESNYECAIRQGSPARNLAYAKLALFPKAYTNALTRQEQAENDVSIWKITRLANGDPVSASFPYYEINPKFYPEINQILSTFSYPSELLGYETLLKNLNLLFAETVVMDFDRDLIISGTGLSSQVGSSGGILVDIYTNNFAGLIFAVSKDEEIAKRKLFSLTPYSVERVVQNETGLTLPQFLNQ